MFCLILGMSWRHALADLICIVIWGDVKNLLLTWKLAQEQVLAEIQQTIAQSSREPDLETINKSLTLVHNLQATQLELCKLNTETLVVLAEELRSLRTGGTEYSPFPWEIGHTRDGFTHQ